MPRFAHAPSRTRLAHGWPLTLALSLGLAACSTPPGQLPASPASRPESWPTSWGEGWERSRPLVIVGSNDLHGALFGENQQGGLAWVGGYLAALRSRFGSQVLYLDAGDQFQGSLESNEQQGAPMIDFFNEVNLAAAALGNHEFDFGTMNPRARRPALDPMTGAPIPPNDLRGALRARVIEAKFTYLAANIQPPVAQVAASRLLDVGGIRVGIIGGITQDTRKQTLAQNVVDLAFEPLAEPVAREAKSLRARGAQAVVLVAHAGVNCITARSHRASLLSPPKKRSELEGRCEGDSEIGQLLAKLPPGTLDAVVSGHTHTLVHHWIEGVPVIQAGSRGRYLNAIYLALPRGAERVDPELTRIQGPIPVCHRMDSVNGECAGEGKGDAPEFLGIRVSPARAVTRVLEPHVRAVAERRKQIVARAPQPLTHLVDAESPLGNLVVDAIRRTYGLDAALMNPRGIRSSLPEGDISYGALFESLPFDNLVTIVTVTGTELKRLLRVAGNGSRGYFPVSGIRQKLLRLDVDAPSRDCDSNGRVEPWEFDRFVEAVIVDETGKARPIADQARYRVGTVDFLTQGGDDLAWFMAALPRDRFVQASALPSGEAPILRNVVEAYLKRTGELSNAQVTLLASDLVRSDRPRVVYLNAWQNKHRKSVPSLLK